MKEIKIKVSNCKLIKIEKLREFQGNLKNLSKSSLQKLMNSIIKNGFNAPLFLWKNQNYILDGHQRLAAIKKLKEKGYTIKENKLPYIEIEAENFEQAAEMVLTYNSQYGDISYKGLEEFIDNFKLDFEELKNIVDIPNLDININNFEENPKEKEIDENNIGVKNKCPKCEYEW